ncbi:lambda-exonuclease family protein [Streptomyces sp. MI02-7b]|uniref:YqaJ viral recombinase family nuclease n=1 Tax=Streptomyces sp. MI02-7b TaxID=462941 RepID=UPI0029A5F828|nr:YqaJ viral recombinase family protein [Streptomyces sp. MI02-7b]MDX3074585.1 YqaJ viral recombinase family protein [Streptomyces sp. MI02-7b]
MTTTTEAGATAPAPGRRVTPTGRLILPADADRADWLTARRQGLGSSDIAAILGISRFGNALTVWHDKTGGLPLESDDTEPALWGRLNEETVAREWARRNRSHVRRVGLVANIERPWQMCTLDRRVLACPISQDTKERCAVEVKCRDKMKAGQWRKGTPDDVLAQTLWQADVCGFDHIHVACLIGGNDYRQFVVRVADHADIVANLRAAGEQAWQQIVARRPPLLTGEEEPGPLLDLYAQLHPERSGYVEIDRDGDAQDDLTEYIEQAAAESTAKKAKEKAKAKLIGHLGGKQAAFYQDRPAYSYDEESREYVDRERLREKFPEAYEACVEDRVSRRLNIPRNVREEFTS